MQRIERYGVIALVFLLVTILAVSLWGEGKSRAQGLLASVRGGDSERASLEVQRPERAAKSTTQARGPVGRPVPISSPAESSSLGLPRKRGRGKNPDVVTAPSTVVAAPATAPRTTRPLPSPKARQNGAPAPKTASKQVARPETQPRAEFRRPPAGRSYEVKAGDTLSVIAQNELGTYKRWPEIQQLNEGLDPARLRAGMKLRLPARDAEAAKQVVASAPTPAAPKPASKPKVNGQGSYEVRSGDVLSVIAQRELGSARRWPEIVSLNPGIDPDRLIVGARLRMPTGAARVHEVAKADTSSSPRAASSSPARSSGSTRKVR